MFSFPHLATTSNHKSVTFQEEGLIETNALLEDEDPRAEVRLRSTLEDVATSCSKYITITKSSQSGPGTGKTKLDKERMKLCQREVVRN